MGQSVFRTGLSKVGLPGAELGLQGRDIIVQGLHHIIIAGLDGCGEIRERCRQITKAQTEFADYVANITYTGCVVRMKHTVYV